MGLISAVFTVISVILAGGLRPADGGMEAVDAPADALDPEPESSALVV